MVKITVIEEVKATEGYTEEEIKNNIWNSPPPKKGEGRYLIVGKSINPSDFSQIKSKGYVQYWGRDFLEECDMFLTREGWRINSSGIDYLRKKGYEVETDTLEEQKERREKAKKERKEKAEAKAIAEKQAAGEYKKAVAEFETFLGNPEYRERKEGEGQSNDMYVYHIQSGNATIHNDEYTSYCLLPDGRVFSHRHYNGDWWDNFTTKEPVPEEAQKFFREKTVEMLEKRKQEQIESKKKQAERQEKIRQGLLKMLERTTWEELEKTMKSKKMKRFCPRELAEDGKAIVELTIAEAKEIVGESC